MCSNWKLYYNVILRSVGGGKYLHLEIGCGISRQLALGGGIYRHLAIGGGIYSYIQRPKIGGGMFNQINGYEHNFLDIRKKVGVLAPPFLENRSLPVLLPRKPSPRRSLRSRRGFKFLVYPNKYHHLFEVEV